MKKSFKRVAETQLEAPDWIGTTLTRHLCRALCFSKPKQSAEVFVADHGVVEGQKKPANAVDWEEFQKLTKVMNEVWIAVAQRKKRSWV